MEDSEKNLVNRRNVLKTTGVSIAGLGSLSASAAAESDPASCSNCPEPKVIAEDSQYYVSRVDDEEQTYVFWIQKETGRISYRAFRPIEGSINSEMLGTQGGQIEPTNHEDVFSRTNLWYTHDGSCGGYIYDDHYTVGLSVEGGQSLDEYSSGVVSAALCAAVGAYAGGPAGAALGAIICYSVGYFFLDHISLAGAQLTLGVTDCHGGWAREEGICTSVAFDYTSDPSDMFNVEKYSGPHLELGKDIKEELP